MSIIINPSVLSCDFGQMANECTRMEEAGADWLHLDVMDGHFVDNISFGQPVVEGVSRVAKVPLDLHLMIERPDHFFSRFTSLVSNITVHVEPDYDVTGTLKAIRESGCTAGLAVSPPTPFEAVEPYLDQIDLLLIMTVNPGFGGQPFIEKMMDKVRLAKKNREERGLNFHIEVDGGINEKTASIAIESGANVLVAGTAVFKSSDPKQQIKRLRGME
jgi:ribulose-phosphate 3-epimerase